MPHWAAHQLFASFPRTDRSTTFASFRFAGDATQLLSLPLTSNNNENNNNNSSSKTASSNRRRRKGKLTGGYGREQKKKQENSSPSLPRGTDVKVKWPSKVSGEKTNIDTFRTVFETKKKQRKVNAKMRKRVPWDWQDRFSGACPPARTGPSARLFQSNIKSFINVCISSFQKRRAMKAYRHPLHYKAVSYRPTSSETLSLDVFFYHLEFIIKPCFSSDNITDIRKNAIGSPLCLSISGLNKY